MRMPNDTDNVITVSIAVGLRDSPADNAEHSILNYTFHAILL